MILEIMTKEENKIRIRRNHKRIAYIFYLYLFLVLSWLDLSLIQNQNGVFVIFGEEKEEVVWKGAKEDKEKQNENKKRGGRFG